MSTNLEDVQPIRILWTLAKRLSEAGSMSASTLERVGGVLVEVDPNGMLPDSWAEDPDWYERAAIALSNAFGSSAEVAPVIEVAAGGARGARALDVAQNAELFATGVLDDLNALALRGRDEADKGAGRLGWVVPLALGVGFVAWASSKKKTLT